MLTLRRKTGQALVLFDADGISLLTITVKNEAIGLVELYIDPKDGQTMAIELALGRSQKGGLAVSLGVEDAVRIYREELLDNFGNPPQK